MTPTAGIAAHARQNPDKTAIVFHDRRISYGELDGLIDQAVNAFWRHGVRPGDRVGVALRNRPEFFVTSNAAARLGCDVVPVSWRLKRDEVQYVVRDSGATLVVAEDDARETFAGVPALYAGGDLEAALAAEEPVPRGDALDPAPVFLLGYTSGTTGRPKAVRRARADVDLHLRNMLTMAEVWGIDRPDDVELACGPLYHSAPFIFSHQALLLGHTVVQMDDTFDAETALRLIQDHRVTWTHMVPIHFVRILKLSPDVRDEYDLSSVRLVLHGAAPCAPDVKWAIMDVFPPDTVNEIYGGTEGMATFITPQEWRAKPGSVGRAAMVQVKVLDDDGREVPAGTPGTIYMSAVPGLEFTYEGDEAKTAEARREDLFTVNDMGYLDEDGYLFLTDRRQHMIVSGGANIYPAEVEGALVTHPAVRDVTVIGVPDDEWGESVKAIVEAGEAVTAEELIDFCRSRLAHYKCPRTVDFVDALPRDENGKIRVFQLREPYWAGRTRRI